MNVREQYVLSILTNMLSSKSRMQNIRAAAVKSGCSWISELAMQSIEIADVTLKKLGE